MRGDHQDEAINKMIGSAIKSLLERTHLIFYIMKMKMKIVKIINDG